MQPDRRSHGDHDGFVYDHFWSELMNLNGIVVPLAFVGFVMGGPLGLADVSATSKTQDASAQKPAEKSGGSSKAKRDALRQKKKEDALNKKQERDARKLEQQKTACKKTLNG
jgi:hypothetical protein